MYLPITLVVSDVTVVACVMIFTAHKPHPTQKETYFGYYKNDGFAKRKNRGRIDATGKWDMIKDKWVSYYINRKAEVGFSVNKQITADMEWLAEAYMETDYSLLTDTDFEENVLKYTAFLLSNNLLTKPKDIGNE